MYYDAFNKNRAYLHLITYYKFLYLFHGDALWDKNN